MFLRRASRGFSLLELLVAISILGLSLGALLRSSTTATRNVATDERYVYAVELSKSLLAQYSQVPRDGFANSGETSGGFRQLHGVHVALIGGDISCCRGRRAQ
ncbi:MAG: type II secretion system protein, partial [Pseudomonadota bacterium]